MCVVSCGVVVMMGSDAMLIGVMYGMVYSGIVVVKACDGDNTPW